LVLAGVAVAWRRQRLRIALLAISITLPLLGGGWLWLRDSPLVAVEHVRIGGVQGADAGSIETALQDAARKMSTLDVNVGALRAAVARFPLVRDLSVAASFPHGLRIRVIEQPPVAALSVGGVRTAVAADGVVLGPELLTGAHVSLPAIALPGASVPADLRSAGGHVENATVRAELSVLGAAPRVLLGWVSRVYTGPEGLTVAMRNGLSIYFGDASRPHAKWLSAARVLADPSSAGATYVDVRAPERPAAGSAAAGGLEGSAAPAQVSASDPSAAALASVLAEAVNGGSATTPATAATLAPAAAPATATATTPTPASSSVTGAGAGGSTATTTESSAGPSATETSPTETNPGGMSPGGTGPAGTSAVESSPAGASGGASP
jgi:cell division protein FtsQ